MTRRTDIANAFKAARPLIKSGQQTFICVALAETSHPAWEAAIEVIEKRMDMLGGLAHWLLKRHGINALGMQDELRAYRLRWLDALIKEFSK